MVKKGNLENLEKNKKPLATRDEGSTSLAKALRENLKRRKSSAKRVKGCNGGKS